MWAEPHSLRNDSSVQLVSGQQSHLFSPEGCVYSVKALPFGLFCLKCSIATCHVPGILGNVVHPSVHKKYWCRYSLGYAFGINGAKLIAKCLIGISQLFTELNTDLRIWSATDKMDMNERQYFFIFILVLGEESYGSQWVHSFWCLLTSLGNLHCCCHAWRRQ